MQSVARMLAPRILAAARGFPVVILTGPRRAGKTTLLQATFPRASYRLLEDPETLARVRSDPKAFLAELEPPVILDEIQNAPELFNYIRAAVDLGPKRTGRYFLTGSQEAPLMRGVTESMAGRAAIFQLLPLSLGETPKVSLLRGGFPEVLARPSSAALWFSSYVQTYLERDVRAISSIRDLSTFRRFVALVASRCGQILNRTDLAAPLGVSVPTISEWLSILETTGQILLVPPFFENFGKRLIKSPKLFFVDSGLACSLLGIEDETALRRSPFLAPLFEGFVASEIVKEQTGAGRRRQLYYFRDQQGLEVDFLVPVRDRKLVLIEAKASATLRPEMGDPLLRLARAIRRYETRAYLVHRPARGEPPLSALRPGVSALPVEGLAAILETRAGFKPLAGVPDSEAGRSAPNKARHSAARPPRPRSR